MSEQLVKKEDEAFLAELRNSGDFAGAVSIRSKIIKTPKLKLGNAMSKFVKAKAADCGDFFCDVRNENYGSHVTIIPLIAGESASLMEVGTNNVLCSTRDLLRNRNGVPCTDCPHNSYWDDWGTKDNKKIPACKTSIDVVCLVMKGDEIDIRPLSMSFRKNAHKAGKKLVNYLANDPTGLPFGSSYTLSSEVETRGNNDYYVPSQTMSRKSLTLEQLAKVAPIAKQILEAKRGGHIEEESDEDEGSDFGRAGFTPSAQAHDEAPPISDDDLPI